MPPSSPLICDAGVEFSKLEKMRSIEDAGPKVKCGPVDIPVASLYKLGARSLGNASVAFTPNS